MEQKPLVDMLGDIAEFHNKFGIPMGAKPGLLPVEDMGFRISFLFEEMQELVDGFERDDTEEIFDALIDLAYVTLGTAWMMGLPFGEGWARVHTANMLKERCKSAAESKRGSALDICKPKGWVAPDLSDLCTSIVIPPK